MLPIQLTLFGQQQLPSIFFHYFHYTIINFHFKSIKRVVIASTSGVIGCRKKMSKCQQLIDQIKHTTDYFGTYDEQVPNDDSPYCKEIVQNWPYYASKILAEEKTLVS